MHARFPHKQPLQRLKKKPQYRINTHFNKNFNKQWSDSSIVILRVMSVLINLPLTNPDCY